MATAVVAKMGVFVSTAMMTVLIGITGMVAIVVVAIWRAAPAIVEARMGIVLVVLGVDTIAKNWPPWLW